MGKKIYNLFKLLVILWLFFNLGPILGTVLTKIGFDISNFTYLDSAYADALISILLAIVLFILYHKTLLKDLKDFSSKLNENIKICLGLFILLFGIKLGAAMISNFLAMILGVDSLQSENQNIINTLTNSAPLIMCISSVILAPIVEEGIFRLGIKKVIHNKYLFIIISGLVFGLMHLLPSDLSAVVLFTQSIVYVAMGFALAAIYEKHPNIWYLIIIHGINNLIGIVATLLLV